MGTEFNDLFEKWADSYDSTVEGYDVEYKEVFRNYEDILEEVANKASGTVLEFGVGTGNLTKKLIKNGLSVYGVEPSVSMRNIAKDKLGDKATILAGDFIQFDKPENVDTIVSSYAFHHLTNQEKEFAFSIYGKFLQKGGKIVFADTIFEDEKAYDKMVENAKQKGYSNLAKDLQTEYYTTKDAIRKMLEKNGFVVEFTRCNDFVLVMEATKL